MNNFEKRIAEFETRSYSAAYDAQGDASVLMREMLAALQAKAAEIERLNSACHDAMVAGIQREKEKLDLAAEIAELRGGLGDALACFHPQSFMRDEVIAKITAALTGKEQPK